MHCSVKESIGQDTSVRGSKASEADDNFMDETLSLLQCGMSLVARRSI
jgi:hypothetical protein